MKKNNSEEVEVVKETKKEEKALFIQRLSAFLIDFIIIVFVTSFIAMPFIDSDKSNDLSDQANIVMKDYMNHKIDTNTYILQFEDLSYKMANNNGILSIITIFIGVLYYVVFQIYKNGQTLGKMAMKIKIVSDDGDLTMNQMIFRALISNSILAELLSFIVLLSGNKSVYFCGDGLFSTIQGIIMIISALMIMYRKDGRAIHDKLAHTKVIRI